MKKLNATEVLSQERLIELFYEKIKNEGVMYLKFLPTLIRKGVVGEKIETFVASGLETTKVVSENEYVVQAMTTTKEQYVITEEKLIGQYELTNDPVPEGVSSEFKIYLPKGKIIGLKAELLMDCPEAWFMASWGEKMRVQPEDILAVPVGLKPEIYRIAFCEFLQTYKELTTKS